MWDREPESGRSREARKLVSRTQIVRAPCTHARDIIRLRSGRDHAVLGVLARREPAAPVTGAAVRFSVAGHLRVAPSRLRLSAEITTTHFSTLTRRG
jgi:hypothetical protein